MQQVPASKIIASLALAIFFLWRGSVFYQQAFHGFSWDFAINWTAAVALTQTDISLYDRGALHQLAVNHINSGLADKLFRGPFTAFLGLPTTAMLHLPLAQLSFDHAVLVYRSSCLLALLCAVWLTGMAFGDTMQRRKAWLAGALCLFSWYALPFSLQLGQVDAWLILCFAVALFAVSRQHMAIAGLAIGIAVLLKVSPAWLLLYALLRRQWHLVAVAVCTVLAALLLVTAAGRVTDLLLFFTQVLPGLGDSPLHVQNQSLGAALARLFHADNNLLRFDVGIGAWKYVAVIIAAVWMALLLMRDDRSVQEGLALAVLPALLAGPLTWDHYLGWALVPAAVVAARLQPVHWILLLLVLLPLCWPVPYLKAEQLANGWWWRGVTSLPCASVLLLALGVIWPIQDTSNNTVGVHANDLEEPDSG